MLRSAGHGAATVPDDARPILFVGDIQGCRPELERLLERARFVPGEHRLIALGDTVNRGPDAPGVLALLHQAGADPLLGNHELALLAKAELPDAAEQARHASDPGRSAYAQLSAQGQLQSALEWIRGWPLWLEGPDWLAVHAGLHPRLDVAQTDPEFLTCVRVCTAAGERPADEAHPAPEFRPWHAWYRGQRTVMFGHWAQQGLLVQPRLRGLDTGCVWGGKLTGLWWPEDKLVQVPAQR